MKMSDLKNRKIRIFLQIEQLKLEKVGIYIGTLKGFLLLDNSRDVELIPQQYVVDLEVSTKLEEEK